MGDPSSWQVWIVPALAFLITRAVLRLLISGRLRNFAVDTPNERSLHTTPIPRTGGIALLIGGAVGGCICAGMVAFLAMSLMLGALSLLDDRFGLPVLLRFVIHVFAAVLAVYWVIGTISGLEALVAVVGIAWLTNLYNFMDGSDGLAGGMAIAGFGAFAWAAAWAGHWDWVVALASVSAASSAFLITNWPPAKIFLGDVGSIPLGFLSAAVGAWGWAQQWWPVWFPPMVFAPFVVDATLTLLRRGVRGEKVWRAHREHCYQRLVLAGWSKRQLMIRSHALMLVCSAWALVSLRFSGTAQIASLTLFMTLLVFLFLAIERRCGTPSAVTQEH